MPTQYTELAKRAVFMLLACVILMAPSAASLCERRCETASPYLHRLKQFWARSYTHSSGSFEQFVQSLVSAFNQEPRLSTLRRTLVNNVINYRECIMACEHQFSKRSTPRRVHRTYTNSQLFKTICRLHMKKHGSTMNLPSGIRKYCHDNQVFV